MKNGYTKVTITLSFFIELLMVEREKNTILSFKKGDEVVEGDSNLLAHATEYYKILFGPEQGYSFPLAPDLWDENELVQEYENEILTQPFSEEEIKEALFQMEKNKAAGPDSIPIEFYQSCWEIVKNDIIQLFDDFYNGLLDVSRLNYGVITLLPKVVDAEKIQQFRPICLLNCLYKWITKVLTRRLDALNERLILPVQTAFMQGRNIMTGIMSLHAVLHETKRAK